MTEESNALKLLTRAGSGVEAVIVCARLTEAGIHNMRNPGRWGSGRDIYVKEQDLDRAREMLKADEGGFSEKELARLSEQAGRAAAEDYSPPASTQPTPAADDERREPDTPVETPVLKKHHIFNALERIARGERNADAPDNPFGH